MALPSMPAGLVRPSPKCSSYSRLLDYVVFMTRLGLVTGNVTPALGSLEFDVVVPSSHRRGLGLIKRPLFGGILSAPFVITLMRDAVSPTEVSFTFLACI